MFIAPRFFIHKDRKSQENSVDLKKIFQILKEDDYIPYTPGIGPWSIPLGAGDELGYYVAGSPGAGRNRLPHPAGELKPGNVWWYNEVTGEYTQVPEGTNPNIMGPPTPSVNDGNIVDGDGDGIPDYIDADGGEGDILQITLDQLMSFPEWDGDPNDMDADGVVDARDEWIYNDVYGTEPVDNNKDGVWDMNESKINKISRVLKEANLLLEKKPPERVKIPVSDPLGMSLDPYDLQVVEAFFEGKPDVVGTNIVTKMDDAKDYNPTDLRIDLLHGRGKLGLVYMEKDIIYLGQLGTMVDRSSESEQIQSLVRNMARERDIRVI